MSRGTPIVSAAILPDRFCRACDVLWAHENGNDCWLCGKPGSSVPPPTTEEERADLAVNTLLRSTRAD